MESFSRYQVAELIGRTDVATVHRAYELRARGQADTVRLLRMRPEYARQLEYDSVLVESARIASQLNHPNVVQIRALEQDESEWLVVEEYVAGRSLAELLNRLANNGSRLSIEGGLFVAIQVLQGLHAAHLATDGAREPLGIVHRDVSPENIWLGYNGEVLLSGFGYAQIAGRQTPPLPGLGAPRYGYLSPEEALGSQLDARSDLFSVGLVLFELLCGRPAYQPGADLLAQAQRGSAPPLEQVTHDITPDIAAAVNQALTFERERRHPSAEMFRGLLATILYGRSPNYGGSSWASEIHTVLSEEEADDARRDRASRLELGVADVQRLTPGMNADPIASDQTMASTPEDFAGAAPGGDAGFVDAAHAARRAPTDIIPERKRPAAIPAPAPAPAPSAPPAPAKVMNTDIPAAAASHRSVPGFDELDDKPKGKIGTILLAAVVVGLIAIAGFALSSDSNLRLVKRKAREAFVGRKAGGTLTIESLPSGAEVTFDDEPTGRKTPLTIENVESEVPHHLSLVLEGEKPETRTTTISANDRRTLTVVFKDAIVDLSIESEPVGARVFLNDKEVALSPTEFPVRAGQSLSIRIEKLGYKTYEQTFTPPRGQPIKIARALEKTDELLAAEEAEKKALEEANGATPKKRRRRRRRR